MRLGFVRNLKLTVLLLAGVLASAAAAQAEDTVAADELMIQSARESTMLLGKTLKAELERALKADGPIAALGVCKSVAPEIARTVSASFGGQVGRTALRIRNPENAPDAFETQVLERFGSEAANGADVSTLEHAEIVDTAGARTFRYMKAIPMAATPCAACHGTSIAPDVLQAVKELYPSDEAVGFNPGDIRGAFTVTKPLP